MDTFNPMMKFTSSMFLRFMMTIIGKKGESVSLLNRASYELLHTSGIRVHNKGETS